MGEQMSPRRWLYGGELITKFLLQFPPKGFPYDSPCSLILALYVFHSIAGQGTLRITIDSSSQYIRKEFRVRGTALMSCFSPCPFSRYAPGFPFIPIHLSSLVAPRLLILHIFNWSSSVSQTLLLYLLFSLFILVA